MTDPLIKMRKGDEVGEFHPSNVDDMLAHGWEIVDKPLAVDSGSSTEEAPAIAEPQKAAPKAGKKK